MSIQSNFVDFAGDLDKFARQIPQQANQIKRKVAKQILNGVVNRTPVGNRELWAVNIDRKVRGLPLAPPGYGGGRAKGNWQVTIGSPATKATDTKDPTGRSTIAAGQATILAAQPGQDIWISNNLPYIGRLEHGHSKQAPAGMIAQTLATVRAQFPG